MKAGLNIYIYDFTAFVMRILIISNFPSLDTFMTVWLNEFRFVYNAFH